VKKIKKPPQRIQSTRKIEVAEENPVEVVHKRNNTLDFLRNGLKKKDGDDNDLGSKGSKACNIF